MFWAVLVHLAGFMVDLTVGVRRAEQAKDLEIALLRHQVRLLQRRASRPPRLSRWEKLTLAVLATKFSRLTTGPRERLARAIFLVQPATVLRWHRELVRRKWTFRRRHRGGRPPIAAEVEALLLRLAAVNPRWGYGRLQGELRKLGHALGRSTIRDVLKRRRVPPAPRRGQRASTWRQFLARHRDAVLACDCVRPVTNHQIPSAGRSGSEGGLRGTTLTRRRKSEGTRAWVEKRGPPKVCRRRPRSPARYGKSQAA